MIIVTIPKELAKHGDLVLVPRKEYEIFLGWRKATQNSKKKKQTALDKSLSIALREVREGKTLGPFSSVAEMRRVLELR